MSPGCSGMGPCWAVVPILLVGCRGDGSLILAGCGGGASGEDGGGVGGGREGVSTGCGRVFVELPAGWD